MTLGWPWHRCLYRVDARLHVRHLRHRHASPCAAPAASTLSLALADARNYTLQLLARLEQGLGEDLRVPPAPDTVPPLWLAGHVAWLAEYWIARNLKRALGPRCPPDGVRLASVDPQADQWFDLAWCRTRSAGSLPLPDAEAVRAYLLDTLETTLELLEHTPEEDDALYFFRMALFHEDLRARNW